LFLVFCYWLDVAVARRRLLGGRCTTVVATLVHGAPLRLLLCGPFAAAPSVGVCLLFGCFSVTVSVRQRVLGLLPGCNDTSATASMRSFLSSCFSTATLCFSRRCSMSVFSTSAAPLRPNISDASGRCRGLLGGPHRSGPSSTCAKGGAGLVWDRGEASPSFIHLLHVTGGPGTVYHPHVLTLTLVWPPCGPVASEHPSLSGLAAHTLLLAHCHTS